MNINLAKIDFCPGGSTASLQANKNVTVLLSDITTEVLPDSGYDGMEKVTVSHSPVENSTAVAITSNGSHTITPSEGYDATIQVVANVNVLPSMQTKYATPSTSAQTISPDTGYDALEKVRISAVDSSIDSNIVASNIKNGVSILGVTGTLAGAKTEETLTTTIRENGVLVYNPSVGNVFDKANITVDISVVDAVPSDEIWYTTPDGTVQNFTDLTALGASYGGPTIVSNTYSGNKGVIKFASPVTWIGFKLDGSNLIYGPQWLCSPQAGLPVNKLESVWLPDSVTEILGFNHPTFGYIGAFDNCKFLTNLHLGSAVTTIGQGSFIFADGSMPENLDIYISTLIPPTLGDTFNGDMLVSVYSSARTAYQNAWANKGIDYFKVDESLKLQNKTVNPSSSIQTITADSPYVGLGSVKVGAATTTLVMTQAEYDALESRDINIIYLISD